MVPHDLICTKMHMAWNWLISNMFLSLVVCSIYFKCVWEIITNCENCVTVVWKWLVCNGCMAERYVETRSTYGWGIKVLRKSVVQIIENTRQKLTKLLNTYSFYLTCLNSFFWCNEWQQKTVNCIQSLKPCSYSKVCIERVIGRCNYVIPRSL